MTSKLNYNSPGLKEVSIPLRSSVCQQNSPIVEYLAAEDQLDNSDDF